MNINFDDFSILVTDFIQEHVEDSYAFVTDSKISITDFPNFIKFYDIHIKKGNYFEINFAEKPFIGRFGQLIYENCGEFYKLRLVFVDKTYDNLEEESSSLVYVLENSVGYINIKRLVAKQNRIISKLQEALLDKGIFTRDEMNSIFTVNDQEENKERRSLVSEVDNLDDYLSKTKNSIQNKS